MIKTRIVTSGMLVKRVQYYVPDHSKLVGDKAIKKDNIENMKITTSSGNVFYADPISRQDIMEAIVISSVIDVDETEWKLAEESNGSKIVVVKIDELKEVLLLALKAKAGLVGISDDKH